MIPVKFPGDIGDLSAIPDKSEKFQFDTADAEEAYAEMESEAAQKKKKKSPPDNTTVNLNSNIQSDNPKKSR